MATAVSILEDIRQLVDRALRGDQHAMVEIVDRYKQRVFRLCYGMLGQREDAEDVSQDAFLRVWRHLSRWDQRRDFEPWLMAIAANRCRTQLARRKSRSPTQNLAFVPVDHAWQADSAANQLQEEVQLALTDLSANHRHAFLLFHQQHMSYGEISTALGIPEGTAKTWVHRARRELIRRLIAREVIEERRRAV